MLVVIARWRDIAGRLAYRLASAPGDEVRARLGAIECRLLAERASDDIRDAEFRVFSQFGEDGIIQYLIRRVPIERDTFVEIGVGSYAESNTRFLLVHDNWRGLIVDADRAHERFLRRSGLDWRHEIDARTAFVRPDNVNRLITEAGIEGDIGLLSLDIDGNDYWVLEALEVVLPRILVVEYNSTFGSELAVTIPYDPEFRRFEAHYSGLYWGASLPALARLSADKGYVLVGGNGAGNNAFFVRDDVVGSLTACKADEVWVASRFRESRGPNGRLDYVADHRQRLRIIGDLPLWDCTAAREATVSELYGD